MPQIAPPPSRTSVLDKLGNISVEWLAWLRTIKAVSDDGLDLQILGAFAENSGPLPGNLTADAEPFTRSEEHVDLAGAILEGLALAGTARLEAGDNLDPFIRADRSWSELRSDQDTFANRTKYPPEAMPDGSFFRATDNLVVWQKRIVAGTAVWAYVAGIWRDTLANIPTASLGTADAGLLFEVTDYAHVLRWSGSAWGWGPGESGSGYFGDFVFGALAGAWQLCDGTTTTYLKADGTTGSYTTQNLTGHYRKSVAAGADAVAAAVAPTEAAATADIAVGDHQVAPTSATGSAHWTIADVEVTIGPPDRVEHIIGDPGHTHTINADGEPASFTVFTYFRR